MHYQITSQLAEWGERAELLACPGEANSINIRSAVLRQGGRKSRSMCVEERQVGVLRFGQVRPAFNNREHLGGESQSFTTDPAWATERNRLHQQEAITIEEMYGCVRL